MKIPCPFCGGEEKFVDSIRHETVNNELKTTMRYRIVCSECGCGTPWKVWVEDAIALWEKRVENAG